MLKSAFGRLTSMIPRGVNRQVSMIPEIRTPARPVHLQILQVTEVKDVEEIVGGKNELSLIKRFVNKLLIKFSYGSCDIRDLAVLEMKYLPVLWGNLVDLLAGTPGIKVFSGCGNQKNHGWGACSMNVEPMAGKFEDVTEDRFFWDALASTSAKVPFAEVVEWTVKKYHATHCFPDVRYLMYLEKHPVQVPEGMKNNKYNVVAGTVVMAPNPHVTVAKWDNKKSCLNVHLVSLTHDLGADEINIVMWKR